MAVYFRSCVKLWTLHFTPSRPNNVLTLGDIFRLHGFLSKVSANLVVLHPSYNRFEAGCQIRSGFAQAQVVSFNLQGNIKRYLGGLTFFMENSYFCQRIFDSLQKNASANPQSSGLIDFIQLLNN